MYVRFSALIRRLLLRNILWTLPATAIWGLLPVLAQRRLGLGSGGYGVLLGALGVGAVVGAFALAPFRHRFSWTLLVGGGSVIYASCMLATGLLTSTLAVFLVLATVLLGRLAGSTFLADGSDAARTYSYADIARSKLVQHVEVLAGLSIYFD